MALFFVGLVATDGSRRSVGVVILAALLCWVLTAHPRKAILSGLAGAAALLIALNVLLATRGNWTAGVEITKSSFTAVRVDDNFLRLCQTIKAVPADAPYSGWMPVIFAALRPIPRALWPEKPTSPGFTIHEYLGYRGVSLSMSAVGELYTCAGFLSVFLGGFVYGSLCKWLAGLLCLERTAGVIAVYALSYAALFVGIRSMIDLVLFSYPLAAAVVLIKVFSVLHDAHRN
jgi:hypothetical protein